MTDIDARVDAIVTKNEAVLKEFFIGTASGDYFDGRSHQLYLDLRRDRMWETTEASDNTWTCRDDGSLVQIDRVNGYCDIPKKDRYNDKCDLEDFGYSDWLEYIRQLIAAELRYQA